MKKIIAALLCLLLLCAGCDVRTDKTAAFKKYDKKDKSAKIEALCREFYEQNGAVGLSVGILDGFNVKFWNLGALYEGGPAVTEDSIYPLGTMTEMFTGVMWSEWEKREWFVPTTETRVYFPYTAMPAFGESYFNSKQLATHTSALPELPDNFTDFNSYTDLDMRRYLSSAALEYAPGSAYRHSSLGIGLLGYILETRLKTSFEVLMKNSIMYRCLMTSSTITLSEEQEKIFAEPHSADGARLERTVPYSCMQGALGFNSTAYDLMIFASLNLAKVDVSAFLDRAITLAHTPQYYDENITLGYGFFIEPTQKGNLYYNSSCINGASGFFGVDDGSETAVAVLCNTELPCDELAREILAVLAE